MNWKNFFKNTFHILTIVSGGAAAAALGLDVVAKDLPALLPVAVTVGLVSTALHGIIKVLQGIGASDDGK